ncbi:probable G-protein coupled receptor Mth-like 5 [Aphidius gifuensis]|uniref:probable G-protein coupled receptor Mth-like 5 n=1 Tax=Aphidius gifuensis TaxID=684658 RepID=UPI001CDB6F04|nr:probable G-protein coupled receptor Mth-like 5 [Aphidius gifuensis]
MEKFTFPIALLIIVWCKLGTSSIVNDPNDNLKNTVNLTKCCELNEILYDSICTSTLLLNNTEPWKPNMLDDKISKKHNTKYNVQIGVPNCEKIEHKWEVYDSEHDTLSMLPSGKLRHYINKKYPTDVEKEKLSEKYEEEEDLYDVNVEEPFYVDYDVGNYCIDKAILSKDKITTTYAVICIPQKSWTDTDYLIRNIVDPIIRALSISCYILIAIVYFVLPQLRDLVGNMITSMNLCLVVHQIAVTITIFKQYANHFSFFIADTIAYTSLLAAFLWLNAIGYFVWNTFRSRNVFLRVTDGRKYCYYSMYVWGTTLLIICTALFAHFALEISGTPVESTGFKTEKQETIGLLGSSILFLSIIFTIIIDICFILSTSKTIKRMRTYGRIHHKMKYSFRMFTLLFMIISFGWLSYMISLFDYNYIVYFNIIINLFESFLILYICVFGQKRVTFLLSKTCKCCESDVATPEGLDWGEEMTAINAGY